MLSDTRIPSSRVPILTDDNTRTTTREWFRFFDALSSLLAFGTARYTSDQTTAFAADTPTIIPVNLTDFNKGLSLSASRVTVAAPGQYIITARVQLTNADLTNADDFLLWLRVNGVDQEASASWATVQPEGAAVIETSFYADFAEGAYFELYGLSKLGYAQAAVYAASVSPAYPASPSVILTATQIL